MKRKVGRIFVICLILMMINPHSIHAEEPRQEARELEAKRVNQFFTDEINALIDENYEKVLADGWAELRIPRSLHGITEDEISPNALDAAHRLMDAGYKAYLIGGANRDRVLGEEASDFDIVTDAPKEAQEELLVDMTFHTNQNGLVFGFSHYPEEVIDVATCLNIPAAYYGKEGVPDFDPTQLYSDSFVFDSFERDLTINALYYDVETGDLVDYHGGLHDLREGIINTMMDPEIQLESDPPSAIRALRFKARYNFEFSPRLEKAMRENGANYLRSISDAMFAFNLPKFFPSGYGRASYDVLNDYNVFATIYPPVSGICDTEEYRTYAEAAMDLMDQSFEDGTDFDNSLSMAFFLWPVIEDAETTEELHKRAASVLEGERTVCEITDEEADAYLELFELEDALTSECTDEEAQEIAASGQFENALWLLRMRAETSDDLADAVAFWEDLLYEEEIPAAA